LLSSSYPPSSDNQPVFRLCPPQPIWFPKKGYRGHQKPPTGPTSNQTPPPHHSIVSVPISPFLPSTKLLTHGPTTLHPAHLHILSPNIFSSAKVIPPGVKLSDPPPKYHPPDQMLLSFCNDPHLPKQITLTNQGFLLSVVVLPSSYLRLVSHNCFLRAVLPPLPIPQHLVPFRYVQSVTSLWRKIRPA